MTHVACVLALWTRAVRSFPSHACPCACMHGCVRACVCVCMCACACASARACVRLPRCAHVRMMRRRAWTPEAAQPRLRRTVVSTAAVGHRGGAVLRCVCTHSHTRAHARGAPPQTSATATTLRVRSPPSRTCSIPHAPMCCVASASAPACWAAWCSSAPRGASSCSGSVGAVKCTIRQRVTCRRLLDVGGAARRRPARRRAHACDLCSGRRRRRRRRRRRGVASWVL